MTEFQPYPLRLTDPNGKRIRVLSKQEHDKLLEEWGAKKETAPETATPADKPVVDGSAFDHDGDGKPGGSLPHVKPDEFLVYSQATLEAVAEKAKGLGIKVDKRWGMIRLQAEIKKAEKKK